MYINKPRHNQYSLFNAQMYIKINMSLQQCIKLQNSDKTFMQYENKKFVDIIIQKSYK